MAFEQKVIRRLFGDAKNTIQNVYGPKRTVIELMIARKGFGKAIGAMRAASTPVTNIPDVFKAQILMAESSKSAKYVHYNGHIYLDCFAPKWPGKAFSRMADALIRDMTQGSDAFLPFIPSLVFSITKKCMYRCEHCYAIHSLGGKDDVPVEKLLQIAKDFQKIGVAVLAWEGGEPLLRFDDLLFLIRATREESDSILATTAHGLTVGNAQQLKEAGLDTAIVSLDHYDPDKHNRFRGNNKSFDMAVNGVRLFRENGILPSVAICATREIMAEGGLYRYLDLAREIGAAFIQVLDATPSGNYMGKDVALTREQLEEIKRFQVTVNREKEYRDHPGIQARALMEDDDLYGCCGGNALVYVDNSGNLQACDLLQISFGNVLDESVDEVYKRMKEFFPHPWKGRCPAQGLHREIAGIYETSESLPLKYQDCLPVLEKIARRGKTDRLKAIEAKKNRVKAGITPRTSC